MRTISPTATRRFDGRVTAVRGWAGGWLVMGPAPGLVVVDRALATVATVAVTAADAALDAAGARLIVAADGGLRAWTGPGYARRGWDVDDAAATCRLGVDDARLWTAAASDDAVLVTVRDPATGDARGEVRLDDPFGGAAVMLWRHPDPACVVASIAAGQDGQAAYLIRDDGGVVTAREVPPRDRLPPVFTATGDAYLSGDADALEHRAWPSGDVLGEAAWSWDDDVEVDDPAGEDLQDLGGGFASWASEHGRLYAVDLARMERVDEIVIEGHPVVPLATRYPALAGDLTPCGDLRWSAPGPVGLIATVHGDATLAVSRVDDWRPPGASR